MTVFDRPLFRALVVALCLLGLALPAQARSSHSASSGSHHRSTYATSVPRNSHGKIKRDAHAKHEFMAQTGYRHGRPGYVVDHVIPLKRGGCDCPSNMQWQTKAEAKAKDKWE